MRMGVFTAGILFCHPALWTAWFLAETSASDWQWSIGPLHLAGSHASWVLLLIFCVLLVEIRRIARELDRFREPRPRTQIDRIAGPLFKYALPLAVITSWIGI